MADCRDLRWLCERWAVSRALPVRILAFVAALCFLAGALGIWVGRTTTKAPSRADVGALQDMITHHEQAVEMSIVALGKELPPPVKVYAQEVILEQRLELGLMMDTLNRWGKSLTGGPTAMGWMGQEVSRTRMPGLMPRSEMERLQRSSGDETAALWLAMMSLHHLGGVEMATAAEGLVRDSENKGLFARIVAAQVSEIQEYARTRTVLGLPVPDGYTDPPRLGALHSHNDHGEHHSTVWLWAALAAGLAGGAVAWSIWRSRSTLSAFLGRGGVVVLAAASSAAGAIHLAMTAGHFEEAVVFGVFFAAAAALQLVTGAFVAMRPSSGVLGVMAIGNVVVIVVWLLSRTIGLPVGPELWVAESPWAADISAVVLQVVVVGLCVMALVAASDDAPLPA